MGYDYIPAVAYNGTEYWAVVKEDEGGYRWLPPGERSSDKMWSVDGIGIIAVGSWNHIAYNGHVSTFWKISDGSSIGIFYGLSGFYLKVYYQLPFLGPQPASFATFGGFTGYVEQF